MIRHIVLYRFKPEFTDKEIIPLFNKLTQLKNLVPGVEAMQWGKYCGKGDKNAGYTYGLSVDIADESVFLTYSPHPLHNEVRQQMAPLLAEDEPLLMFDFLLTK